MLDNFVLDVRLAWRGLCRARGFSAAAILTLGLGIAGATVMFTLIQGVLLRPMPVREQERLILSWKELRASGYAHYPFGDAEIEDVGAASQLLEMVAGVDANGAASDVITDDGASSYIKTALVTGGFFDVLGVTPVLGRTLNRADDREGAENVLVISHGLWRRRYGAARDVVGRRVSLGEERFAIVGVMPADVDYPIGVEAWRTTHSVPTTGPFGDAARREIDLIARLKPAVTMAQATSELAALTAQTQPASPGIARDLTPVVRPFTDVVIGNVRPAVVALTAAVALILLIACANVANLLLMRSEGRRAELAMREALGAGRGRIVGQLLAESLLLTSAATVVGLVVTWWSVQGLLTLLPEGLPRVESVRIDGTVVLCTVLLGLMTTLLAGFVPALSLARADLLSQLRGSGRGATGASRQRGRRALVVAQVALAVTVLAGAGLLVRSVLHLQAVDLGLAADRLVFVELSLPQTTYRDRTRHAQFLDRAVSELQALPAIAAATPVNARPFSGDAGWDVPRFTAEGQSAERAAANPSLNLESVFPNYFATFGIVIVRGRAFTDADRDGSLQVAIVSADVAERIWPGENPIGKRLNPGGPDSRDPWLTVVGVAAPTRYRDLAMPRATLYLPAAQFLVTAQTLVLRTGAPLEMVASLARERVNAVDPNARVMRVAPFARMLDVPMAHPRFNAFLLSIFAFAALLLATVGLYAVMAAYVRQRDREIAVRIALGATAVRVRGLVLGEAVWLAGVGAVIGLAAAAAATRMMQTLLFEINPLDPSTLLGAALLVVAGAALASYLPARRATRIDSVAMLRN